MRAVLRDHQRFSSAAGVGLGDVSTDAYSWRGPSLILGVDPPVHTAHRGVVAKTMSPRAMQTFQDVDDTEAAALPASTPGISRATQNGD